MKIRVVAAIAVLVSAAVHLWLWLSGMSSVPIIGPAFMVNAVAGVVIACVVLLWRHWLPLFLAAGFGASTLGAFIVSTTVGLFGVQEQWVGNPVWTAAISEFVAIVAGLGGLWQEVLSQSVRDRRTSSGSRAGSPIRQLGKR